MKTVRQLAWTWEKMTKRWVVCRQINKKIPLDYVVFGFIDLQRH